MNDDPDKQPGKEMGELVDGAVKALTGELIDNFDEVIWDDVLIEQLEMAMSILLRGMLMTFLIGMKAGAK